MADPLLTKDAVNIAGHKLPLPLVGAAVGLLGVVLVLRARSSGSNVAAAGTPAAMPASVGVFGQGQEAQLANLAQQLGDIERQLNPPGGGAAGPGVTNGTAAPAGRDPRCPTGMCGVSSRSTITGALGNISVWLHTAPSAESPVGALLRPGESAIVSGAPLVGGTYVSPVVPGVTSDMWLPVNIGGTTEYAFLPEVNIGSLGG